MDLGVPFYWPLLFVGEDHEVLQSRVHIMRQARYLNVLLLLLRVLYPEVVSPVEFFHPVTKRIHVVTSDVFIEESEHVLELVNVLGHWVNFINWTVIINRRGKDFKRVNQVFRPVQANYDATLIPGLIGVFWRNVKVPNVSAPSINVIVHLLK